MQYDPIKRHLGIFFNKTPFLRKSFYLILDILLLRAWHIKKETKIYFKTLKGELTILDAGSGYGQYDYFLSNLKPKAQIIGIDVKDEQIEDCNKFFEKIGRKNVKFFKEDLTKYVQDSRFDFILCVDVIEHIEDDIMVFTNFYKSLKLGGMLLISTPSDLGGSDVHQNDDHSFIDEHVRDGYSKADIAEKLQLAGFQNVEARYSYGTFGQISWLLSMKYPIKLLNISKLFFILLPLWYLLFFPLCCMFNFVDVKTKSNKGTGLIVKAIK